jgi:glycosyltransferase involved in cell wall biosynthesis
MRNSNTGSGQEPPVISVVTPVLNEAGIVQELVSRIESAVEAIEPPVHLELVIIDDGSTDGTLDLLKKLADSDNFIRVLELSRNFGHQAAITAGIDHATGDAVVVMDGDLQDPPEVIPTMVERWRDGVDVVYAVRERRQGEVFYKRVAASVHYRIQRWLSDVDIPVDTGDFRLMSRRVVDELVGLRESSRYIRGLVAWLGFSQEAVPFVRDPRFAGDRKYTFRKLVRLSLDGLTSFTDKPLRLASQIGALTTIGALAYGAWIIVARLIDPDRAFQGFSAIMVTILMLGGIQLFAIGILGEYLGRVYVETKRRPLYVVREEHSHGSAEPRNVGDE